MVHGLTHLAPCAHRRSRPLHNARLLLTPGRQSCTLSAGESSSGEAVSRYDLYVEGQPANRRDLSARGHRQADAVRLPPTSSRLTARPGREDAWS